VTVSVYVDSVPINSISAEARTKLAEENADKQLKLVNNITIPNYVVVTPDGKVLDSRAGYFEVPVFTEFLSQALAKHQGEGKVASAGTGL
jgi:hypothetical protein